MAQKLCSRPSLGTLIVVSRTAAAAALSVAKQGGAMHGLNVLLQVHFRHPIQCIQLQHTQAGANKAVLGHPSHYTGDTGTELHKSVIGLTLGSMTFVHKKTPKFR